MSTLGKGTDQEKMEYLHDALQHSTEYRQPAYDIGWEARRVGAGENDINSDAPSSTENLWREYRYRWLAGDSDIIVVPHVESASGEQLNIDVAEQLNDALDAIFNHSTWENTYIFWRSDCYDWNNGFLIIVPDDTPGKLRIQWLYFADCFPDPNANGIDDTKTKFFIWRTYEHKPDCVAKYKKRGQPLEEKDFPTADAMPGYEVVGLPQNNFRGSPSFAYSFDASTPLAPPTILRASGLNGRDSRIVPLNDDICCIYHGIFVDPDVPTGLRFVEWLKDDRILLSEPYTHVVFPMECGHTLITPGQSLQLSLYKDIVAHQENLNHVTADIDDNVSLSAKPVPLVQRDEMLGADGKPKVGYQTQIIGGQPMLYTNKKPEFLVVPSLNEQSLRRPGDIHAAADRQMLITDTFMGRTDKSKTLGETEINLQMSSPSANLLMKSAMQAMRNLTKKLVTILLSQVGISLNADVTDLITDMTLDIQFRNMSGTRKTMERREFTNMGTALVQWTEAAMQSNMTLDEFLFITGELSGTTQIYTDFRKSRDNYQKANPPVMQPGVNGNLPPGAPIPGQALLPPGKTGVPNAEGNPDQAKPTSVPELQMPVGA